MDTSNNISLLDEPMVNWKDAATALKPEALVDAVRSLDSLIERAARLRGYLDGRYGHGCGDQGHADAVKMSNALAAKVRKALGFTYKDHPLTF